MIKFKLLEDIWDIYKNNILKVKTTKGHVHPAPYPYHIQEKESLILRINIHIQSTHRSISTVSFTRACLNCYLVLVDLNISRALFTIAEIDAKF